MAKLLKINRGTVTKLIILGTTKQDVLEQMWSLYNLGALNAAPNMLDHLEDTIEESGEGFELAVHLQTENLRKYFINRALGPLSDMYGSNYKGVKGGVMPLAKAMGERDFNMVPTFETERA